LGGGTPPQTAQTKIEGAKPAKRSTKKKKKGVVSQHPANPKSEKASSKSRKKLQIKNKYCFSMQIKLLLIELKGLKAWEFKDKIQTVSKQQAPQQTKKPFTLERLSYLL
jgi:hypothetical protein